MRKYLIVKLLAVNLVILGFAVLIIWVSIDTLAAGYFVTLMEKYHISPEPAHEMFVSAVHKYIVWVSVAAVGLTSVLSFLMMRKILRPLSRMTIAAGEIAEGKLDQRVPENSRDEIGQLAAAFNQMAESLEKLMTLRRNLMIDVAHELRTPLTNIRGYLEGLNDGVILPEKKTFELLKEESLRLSGLVEDVLRLARADAAGRTIALKKVDLKPILENTAASFKPRFAEKKITVVLSLPDEPVYVMGDPEKLARIFRNLVDNGVAYTPEQSEFSIKLTRSDRKVRAVFMNDKGRLTEEDIPFLFERFYRGEKSRSRLHGGAGIGLAIVKGLVEAHHGSAAAALENNLLKIEVELDRA